MNAVARGGFVNLVSGGVSAGSTFVLAFALTQALPADKVGAFYTVTSLFLLVTLFGQLGTQTGLVYFIARDERASGGRNRAAYLQAGTRPVLALATLMSIFMFVGAETLATWTADGDPQVAVGIRVTALFVVLAAVLNLYAAASRGLGTMMPTAVHDQVLRPSLQIVLVLAAMPTRELWVITLAWGLPYLSSAVGIVRWWRRHGQAPGTATDRGVPPTGLTREFWRFTGPRALAGVTQMAMQRLDIVLVGAMAGLAEAAIYTVATRFHVLGQLPGQSLARATQPRLAAALGSGSQDEARRLYQVATCWLVLGVWPFYLVLALGADHLLALFGSEYADGRGVLVLLSLTMLVATGCGMVDNVLTMGGKTSWNLYNVVAAFVVNLVVDLVLIPDIGMLGAAVGWSAGILVANLLPLGQVHWALHLHPFGGGTRLAMGLAAACFGLLPVAALAVLGSSLAVDLCVVALATLVYAVAVWRWHHMLHIRLPSRRPA